MNAGGMGCILPGRGSVLRLVLCTEFWASTRMQVSFLLSRTGREAAADHTMGFLPYHGESIRATRAKKHLAN
jgi:hypothetical protein